MSHLNEIKISYKYVTELIFMTIAPTAILYLPVLDYKYAKQDSWIPVLITSLYGLLCVYIFTTLSEAYPNKTIIEYSTDILGKFFGKFIGLLICIYYLHITSVIIREFTEVLAGPFLPRTNTFIFSVSIILPSIYSIYKGIEVITRVNRIIFPIFVVSVGSILLLGLKDMDFNNLLPITDIKISDIFSAVYPQLIWFGQPFILTMLFPYVDEPQMIRKRAFIAVGLVALLGVVLNMAIVATFEVRAGSLSYPFLSLTRYIGIGSFLTRMDSLLIIIWVAGVLIKITIFYYCAVIGITKLFNLKKYNLPTIPVAILLISGSYFLWNSIVELTHQLDSTLILLYTFIQFFIPVLLLLITFIKRRYSHEK